MATVLLLLLSAVTGAIGFSSSRGFLSKMVMPVELDLPENSWGCPLGQMFCFSRMRCVDRVDKSCPKEPNCPAYQVVCNVGGNLECVMEGTCEKIDVKFKIKKSYDAVVGVDHGEVTAFINNLRQKLAEKLGRPVSAIWGVEIHPDESSVWVAFHSVPDAEADLNNIFKKENQQFLKDQNGLALEIDFSQGGFMNKDCGTRQICWKTEEPQCVPEPECPRHKVEVTMDADYGATVGMDQQGFQNHLVSQISDGLIVPREAIEHSSVYPGSIILGCETSLPDFKQRVQDLIDNGHFPKDLLGNLLTVTRLTATLINGDGSSGDGSGDWKFDWNMPYEEKDDYCVPGECMRCQSDEYFCFMTQNCVKEDRTCVTDECEATQQDTCRNPFSGDPYCTPPGECPEEPMQATFTLDGNCPPVELHDSFKDSLRFQLAEEMAISESEITNLEITCGSIIVTMVVQRGNPTALNKLKALVESGGPLEVGSDTYQTLPESLRFGNCERDSDGHCINVPEQCPAPEVTCWHEDGTHYCDVEGACTLTRMPVFIRLDGDTSTVDLGTPNFKMSLQTALTSHLGLSEADLLDFEVSFSDDGTVALEVDFVVESSSPPELDDILKSIKVIADASQPVNVDGKEYRLTKWLFGTGAGGTCPDPDSALFTSCDEVCNNQPCDHGKLCCYSDQCQSNVCVAPEGAKAPDGVCPATNSQLFTDMCGNMQACIDSSTCNSGEICCYSDLCGDQICIGQPDTGSGDDHSGSSSGSWELPDFGSGSGDGCAEGENCKQCLPGQIFCFMSRACVDSESAAKCEDEDPAEECTTDEDVCWNRLEGTKGCVDKRTCVTNSIRAAFILEGDFDSITDLESFKAGLSAALASMLQVGPEVFGNLEIKRGSILVIFEVIAADPTNLDDILSKLKGLSEEGGVLEVLGTRLPIKQRSLQLGGSTDCAHTDSNGNCIECVSPEMWCPDEMICKTDCTPPEPERDVFYISIELDQPFDYFASSGISGSFLTDVTQEVVKARLEKLEDVFRQQLKLLFVDTMAEIHRVTAIPTRTEEEDKHVMLWARISAEKGSQTIDDLENMLSPLQGTGLQVDGNSMTFTFGVHKLPDEPIPVIIVPWPFVAGKEMDLDIREIIPQSMREKLPAAIRDSFLSQTSITCEEETGVYFRQPGSEAEVQAVTLDATTSIVKLINRNEQIELVSCSITFSELLTTSPVTKQYKLGLLVVPDEIRKLAQPGTITLAKSVIEQDEDSHCQKLPDKLFNIEIPGDPLVQKFDHWQMKMIEKGEKWVADDLSQTIQSLVLDYVVNRKRNLALTRHAYVKISDETVYTDDKKLVARLIWKQGSQEMVLTQDDKGGKTDLLATRDNFEMCVRKDYNGEFILEITPAYFDTLQLPVLVNAVNDAPFVKEDISTILKSLHYAYPRVKVKDDEDITPPEISAAELARQCYSDQKDRNDNLGLVLFGSVLKPNGVGGNWEYKLDAGADWMPVPEFSTPNLDGASEVSVPVIYLGQEAKLKFALDPAYESKTWKRSEGPGIKFGGLDLTLDLDPNLEDTMMLHYCVTGSKKLCGPGGTTVLSEAVIDFQLPRYGCDGFIDSGSELLNEACDCDEETCPDCKGIDGGGADWDECGICAEPGVALESKDCCLLERDNVDENWKEYCDAQDEIAEQQKCPTEAEKRNVCGDCVAVGSDLSGEDQCGFICGDNSECSDCFGQPNGNAEKNPCGECKNKDELYTDCEIAMKHFPKFVYAWPTSHIWLAVTDALSSTPVADISCSLSAIEDGPVVPDVTSIEFETDDNSGGTNGNVIKLTLTVSEAEALDSAGKYDISCQFGSHQVSITDYHTRFTNPKLKDLSPPMALIDDLEKVTIYGAGFVDTGNLSCVIPCSDLKRYNCRKSANGVAYYTTHGEFVDESTAKCDLSGVQKFGRGGTVNINVILGEEVDMAKLPSPLPFTVKMPSPNLVSAVLDRNGCSRIDVGFDKYIKASIGREGPCSQFFTAVGANIASGVTCYLKGKMIVMEFDEGASVLPAGTQLTLQSNIIYDQWVTGEDSANNPARTYASGTVTVVEPAEMIQPVVTIFGPKKVGAQPEDLKVRILNSGCLKFNLDWSAEAVNPDPANTELTSKVTAFNDYLSGLNLKRWLRINAQQLVSGQEFQLTLTWSAKQYSSISGTVTHIISRDDSKLLTAEIMGLQNEKVDIREPLQLVAQVQMNTDQYSEEVEGFIYEWTVLPSTVKDLKRSRPRLWIPSYTLRAGVTYTVKLKVSYGDNIFHETKIRFQTQSHPPIARINGDDQSELMWPLSKDLVLTADVEDPDRSSEVEQFTWTCKNNRGSDSPEDVDSFRPCMELVDGSLVPVERLGDTVDLLAAERNSLTAELWTLICRKGTRSSKAQKLIKFEEVQSVPKIILRTKKLIIGPNSEDKMTYRIKAWCKAKTGHIWRGDQGKDNPELDVNEVAKFPDQIEVKYGENSDANRYQRCHLTLDFSKPEKAQFINGQTYKLTVTAYSEYLSSSKPAEKSASVTIETWTKPNAGTIEVSPADPTTSSFEAMKTKFQMRLYDWLDPQDGVNLKCRYFYKTSGSEYESPDHRYEPMDKQPIFTLPEGTFTFKATCCNTNDLCESATSADTITVEPVDIAAEEASGDILKQVKIAVKAVTTALQALSDLIRYASQIATTASTAYRDEVKQTLQTEVNTAILKTVPEDSTESDDAETIQSVKKSVDVLKAYNKPAETSKAVAKRLMMAVLRFSRRSIGHSGSTSKRRRKREVITNYQDDDAEGMTVTEAQDLLYVFGLYGNDSAAFEDILDEELADGFKDLIDNVMTGMCIAYDGDGTTAWNAVSELVTVQLKKESLEGDASVITNIVESPYTEAALINYGADLAAEYDDSWECSNETAPCTDVCIATAQLGLDFITMTASLETAAPIRHSDLVITKLINPENTVEELIVENLVNPIVVTIQTNANNLTDFDLLCMMWIAEKWSDSTCTTGLPTPSGSTYQVECSCTQTGILGVFQTEKSNTTGAIAIITTTAAPSPQKPSKQLKSNTVSATCEFKLDEDFDAQLAKSSQTEIQDHFKQRLIDQTGYSNSIKNVRIERGSVVVIFDLFPSSTPGSDTLGEMLAAIESMVQSGTLVLTNPDGDTLTILTNSFTYEEQSSGDDDDKKTSALPYILGGVLGGLAIIGLFVVLTIIAIKKTRGNRTRPNTPVSPAPAYENAKPMYPHALPPPYSALSTPSKDKLYPGVEKWTENELKVAHPHPETKKAPRSTGSASSTERRLIMTLEEERQPTPVDN